MESNRVQIVLAQNQFKIAKYYIILNNINERNIDVYNLILEVKMSKFSIELVFFFKALKTID